MRVAEILSISTIQLVLVQHKQWQGFFVLFLNIFSRRVNYNCSFGSITKTWICIGYIGGKGSSTSETLGDDQARLLRPSSKSLPIHMYWQSFQTDNSDTDRYTYNCIRIRNCRIQIRMISVLFRIRIISAFYRIRMRIIRTDVGFF